MNIKRKIFIILAVIFVQSCAKTSNHVAVLPLLLSVHGLPVTSVQIQEYNIPIIFDNGATSTSIALNKELVEKLHLNIVPTNNKSCFLNGSGKKTCLKVYTVPKLNIGQMTMSNIPCQLTEGLWGEHYDGELAAARNGAIGLNLLRQFNVLIDYQASQIILMKLGEYPYQHDMKDWMRIPFSNKYGITTTAKINGTNVTLVWDTGANYSMIKSTAKIFVNKKSSLNKNSQSCKYFETTALITDGKQSLNTKLSIQKAGFPFDGLIGSSFFKEHRVFFDFKNNLLFVELEPKSLDQVSGFSSNANAPKKFLNRAAVTISTT